MRAAFEPIKKGEGKAVLLLVLAVVGMGTTVRAQPTVTDLRPENGAPGSEMRIYGSGFNSTASNNTVEIGGATVTPDSGSTTVLYAQVPSGVSGPVPVRVDNGSGFSSAPELFVVAAGAPAQYQTATDTLVGVTDGEADFGDVDNDGDLDLVVLGATSSSDATTALYLNQGGTYKNTSTSTFEKLSRGTIDLVELTGDGNLDLFVTGAVPGGGPRSYLYPGNGDGTFGSSSTAGVDAFQNSAADFGDVDTDGDLDLLVNGINGSGNRATQLYTNDGSGAFTPQSLTLPNVSSGTAHLGDVDGDGGMDLLITGMDGTSRITRVYLNDGSLNLTSVSLTTGVSNSAADLGDVDGDGDLDFLVAGSDGSAPTTTLYRNDGTGSFTGESPTVPDLKGGTVDLADADGDGSPDVFITGSDTDGLAGGGLFLNDGTGGFFSANSGLTAVKNSAAAVFDYNGDGILDPFLTGNDGSARAATLYGTPLEVQDVSPLPNVSGVSRTRSLEFSFIVPVASLPGLADSIVVRGAQSGPIGGTLGGVGTNVLSYDPSQNFVPGEEVTISLLKGIESTGGIPLDTTRTYKFTAAADPGPAVFPVDSLVSTSEDGARAVAVGDLDGDGDRDLVVGGSRASSVTGYKNDGTGTFGSGTTIDGDLDNTRDVLIADLNGDGALDVVAAAGQDPSNSSVDEIRWYANDGSGGFGSGTAVVQSSPVDDVRAIAAGDADGDGDVDLVSASSDNSNITVHENRIPEGGSFSSSAFPTSANDPRAIDLEDLDGDGDLDILRGSVSSDALAWYANGGSGSFGSAQSISVSTSDPKDVHAVDLDGNGTRDLLYASQGFDEVRWTPNLGGGSFDSAGSGVLTSSADSVEAVHPADVDGDGDLDVLTATARGDSLSAFLNDGSGTFSLGATFEVGADGAQDIAAADLDGDGRLDPVGASYNDDTVAHYPNISSFRVTGTSPAQNRIGVDTALAQVTFTFNSALDGTTVDANSVTLTGEQSGRIPVANVGVQNTSELYLEPGASFRPGEQVTASVLADSVGATDGTMLRSTYSVQFVAQNASGPVAFPVDSLVATGSVPNSVTKADLDADGDLDVLASIRDENRIVWAENTDGTGTFADTVSVATGLNRPKDVAPADIDRDGDLDVVVAVKGGDRIDWYENTAGDGSSWAAGTVTTNVQDPTAVNLADIDGDGHVDVVSANGFNDKIAWYENAAGDGSSWAPDTISATVETGKDVATADFDGDGDLDVASISQASAGEVAWHENTAGDGSQWTTYTITTVDFATAVDVGDLDADGDADILVSITNEETIAWYENVSGSTSFSEHVITSTLTSAEDVAVGDVDGDGLLDVLSASGSKNVEEKVAWYRNEGSGSFAAPAVIEDNGRGATDLAIGDINQDGDLDVLSAMTADDEITWDPNATSAPRVVTEVASGRLSTQFWAEGAVNPGGLSTDVTFQYGRDSTFTGDTTVTATNSPVVDEDTLGVSATVDGLMPSTTYHYRVLASNTVGGAKGGIQSVTTKSLSRIYVDADAVGDSTGASWSDAVTSLQTALSLAGTGDTIWVAEGTYYPDHGVGITDNRRDTSFVLKDSLHIYGGFSGGESALSDRDVDGNQTILSGDVDGDGVLAGNSYHVVVSPQGITRQARLDGFTVTGGNANSSSGSEEDTDGDGVVDTRRGGGLYLNARSAISSPTLANLTFTNNQATGSGGAVYLDASDAIEASPEIGNVTFAGNGADQGGAMAIVAGGNGGTSDLLVVNAVFHSNSASGTNADGGAVFVQGVSGSSLTPRMAHATVAENTAESNGGGIYVSNLGTGDSIKVHNSILAGNTANGAPNQVNTNSSVGFRYSLVRGSGGSTSWDSSYGGDEGGNIDADPFLAEPSSGDLRLNWASPVIDRGNGPLVPADSVDLDVDGDRAEVLSVDRNGEARFGGRTVDMGAYEGGDVPSTSTFYVDQGSGQDTTSHGGSWNTPYRTLQAGLSAATHRFAAGGTVDSVNVATGIYYPDRGPGIADGDTTSSFRIGQFGSGAVVGGFPSGGGTPDPESNPTVLSGDINQDDANRTASGVTPSPDDVTGNNSLHVVWSNVRSGAASPILRGFTITGGQADGSSRRGQGGGLHGLRGNLRLERVWIRGNVAEQGGGVFVGVGRLATKDVTLLQNAASEGGGMFVQGGSVLLTNTTLAGNEASGTTTSAGGGIFVEDGGSDLGGPSAVRLANVVLTGNLTSNGTGGGGIAVRGTGSTLELKNVTVASNTASGTDGGGLSTASDSVVTVDNTIFWANAADGTGNQAYVAGGGGIDFRYSIVQDSVSSISGATAVTGNSASDPRFLNRTGPDGTAGTADDSLQVEDTSPARNHGDAGLLPTDVTDLDRDGDTQEPLSLDRGRNPRVLGGQVDAGAYEGTFISLVASRDTLGTLLADPDRVGSTAELQLENAGTEPLTDLQVQMEGGQVAGATAAPGDFGADGDLSSKLLPGETRRLTIDFEPSETGLRAARLLVSTAEGGQASTILIGRGASLALNAGDPARGQAVPVQLTVEGGYSPGWDSLYVRPGGTTRYRALPLQVAGTDGPLELQAEVPAELVTTQGVDYYLALRPSGGNGTEDPAIENVLTLPGGGSAHASAQPGHLPVSFDQWKAPVQFASEQYRMVSVPALPKDGLKAALQEAYGEYNPTTWRLLRWEAGNEAYREYPQIDTLRAGQGFWLVTAEGEAPALPEGQTVDADTIWKVRLEPGWNQVGNPFGFSVPWDTVMVASGLTGAQIDGPVAYQDSAYRMGQSQIEPWGGYFVFNAQSQADTLQIPPVGSSGDGTKSAPARWAARSTGTDKSAGKTEKDTGGSSGYTLRVEALSASGTARTHLGVRPGADVGRDSLDVAQAPPIGSGLRLGAMEKVAGRSVAHAYSARPLSGEQNRGQGWRLRLWRSDGASESGASKEIKLRFEGKGSLPEGWGRYLLDVSRKKRIAAGALIRLKPGESRTLKVILGTRAYAEENSAGVSLSSLETELRGSYPNPFSEQATIEYVLSEEQEVTLEVYNVLGQRVRTLVDKRQKPGVHRLRWEGDNRYGTPVGSGVYFYRLEAGAVTETQKMVFVR